MSLIRFIGMGLLASSAASMSYGQAHSMDVESGLRALRTGRFEEAQRSFARLSQEAPDSPEGPFFQAFEMWWKLLDRSREQPGVRLQMEERLEEAARRAQKLQSSPSAEDQQRGFIYLGVARLLDAQSKAVRGSHLGAAGSARQGHRALTEALRRNPEEADALFAMGAYNYFADNMPAVVKGIRLLLFIPGGDGERGIAQLEQAAASSRLFGTEALLLLAHIFSQGDDEDFARALGYVEQASAREPSSPVITLVQADLLFNAGRLGEASERSRGVLQALQGEHGYREDLRRYAAYRAASCRLKLHDPRGALAMVEAEMDTSPPRTAQDRRRWMTLLAAAARDAGHPERVETWLERVSLTKDEQETIRRRLRGASQDKVAAERALALELATGGHREEALRRLEGLLQSIAPSDPRIQYDLGRLLQAQGKFDEARPHLTAAAGAAPPDLAGWAWIRLGWDLEREARRDEAVAFYERAAKLKNFTFQPAARLRRDHPGTEPPEG